MLGGVFDPFSRLERGSSGDEFTSGVHVGVVKSYKPSTNSAMVLVSSINTASAIGPCKVMKPYGSSSTARVPVKGDKVIVAFIDNGLNNAIVLGYL